MVWCLELIECNVEGLGNIAIIKDDINYPIYPTFWGSRWETTVLSLAGRWVSISLGLWMEWKFGHGSCWKYKKVRTPFYTKVLKLYLKLLILKSCIFCSTFDCNF